MGVIQQVLISFRKPEVVWWAVSYFLSWVLGFALFSSFSENAIFSEDPLARPIVAGVLVGTITGFLQWLILRRTRIAGTAWWIAICIFSTPMLMGALLQDQPFLPVLLALIYCLVTGLAMDWLLSVERDGATRWVMLRRHFWDLQGAFLVVYLLATSYVSTLAWGNRLLSSTFVEVSSTKGWQDTDLQLNKGNRVVFQYWNGTWSIDPLNYKDGRFTDADGIPGSTPQKYCEGCDAPLPTGTLGMLVATQGISRVGMPVGNHLVYIAPQDGELYLAMNDSFGQFDDNSGSITVQIQVYNR
jgi:hypothetical protein